MVILMGVKHGDLKGLDLNKTMRFNGYFTCDE
jgi:hypothetical protein